ncbi:sulfite exporter TauE/SafE family protein [Psychrosphaera sp. 1_MG-2023]|uniref:sulfite exporter TauE/SafE family protein n=1 Tax=Psychrosphaera sp. 1_MG-2023 TaxID=3062643 RepID=UPI0026E217E9|nr:sulfite exporter TauE/SafE family protein [Psychrosphaera sp. 1_MG-2023]MDO6719906.1 sulfite exporter TauE/SafE family protein [Psychrosphaera sp. 1_MG-2023]
MMDFILLFIAGLVGGILNSIAGGGSFITFPALVFVGVTPLIANATNTFSSCAGYLSGAYAFRNELTNHKKEVLFTVLSSVVGGGVGAYLLLQTSESTFQTAIPWLLLFATLLFIFGGKANLFLKSFSNHNKYASHFRMVFLAMVLLGVCIYGGFFNAGLGIVVLSYLTLAGHSNINVMNGIKLIVSSSVSLAAILLFILNDSIAWIEGSAVLVGTLIGGYFSAAVSMKVPQQYVRWFVILMSCIITIYFFIVTYG